MGHVYNWRIDLKRNKNALVLIYELYLKEIGIELHTKRQ